MSGLDARIRLQRSGFQLELDLQADPGEVVALLGPNGAGKTTVLRVLAGLLAGGEVHLGGRRVDVLPPEDRRVGLVPSDGLLLPHLSALDNVAYGPRARGVRKRPARSRAAEELARLGLADKADARPRELSGGQAQRVALARALATDPDLLLLDEPLAALDALTRDGVRRDLATRLRDVDRPVVLVTHDATDALQLADRVVVLEGGAVVQAGRPEAVLRAPATAYVAGLGAGARLSTGTGWPG